MSRQIGFVNGWIAQMSKMPLHNGCCACRFNCKNRDSDECVMIPKDKEVLRCNKYKPNGVDIRKFYK